MLLLGAFSDAHFCCEVVGICVHGSASLVLMGTKAYQNILGEKDAIFLSCFWCQAPSSAFYAFLKVSAFVNWLSQDHFPG